MKIGPVVSAENRLTNGNWLHVHVVQRILSNISGYTGPIFAIFSPYESSLCIDDGFVLYFPICQGTLPWQPKCWDKWVSNEGGLIPPVFFALAFENELEYHYLYVRINSSDDQATPDINLVGFWPVPPEFNCVEQASISDRVGISTFSRWQHGYV